MASATGAIWVHGETTSDGALAKISTEVATAARELGASAGLDVVGVVVASDPGPAANELAQYLSGLRGPNGATRQPEYRDTFPEPVKSKEKP